MQVTNSKPLPDYIPISFESDSRLRRLHECKSMQAIFRTIFRALQNAFKNGNIADNTT